MFVIFDLDGTLALNGHRLHHIQKEPRDYDAYHAACPLDEVCAPVLRTLEAHMIAGHRVEIWSGRSDRVRAETVQWLVQHGLDSALLARMRPAGDNCSNVDLKRGWLAEARAAGWAPDLVYEDMSETTAMWRAEGVACFQVAAGE